MVGITSQSLHRLHPCPNCIEDYRTVTTLRSSPLSPVFIMLWGYPQFLVVEGYTSSPEASRQSCGTDVSKVLIWLLRSAADRPRNPMFRDTALAATVCLHPRRCLGLLL